jgi:TolB-like protein
MGGIALAWSRGVERWFPIFIAALFAWTTSAHADTKVVVRSFFGPGSSNLRHAVVKQLAGVNGVRVVDESAAQRTAKRHGVSLDNDAGKKEVARELQISAWVEGHVRKKAGKLSATVTVIDAESGNETGSWSFTRKKPKQIEQAAAGSMKGFKKSLNDTRAPEAPAAQETGEEFAPAQEGGEEELVHRGQPVAQAEDNEMPGWRNKSGDDEEHIDGDEAEDDHKKREYSAFEARFGAGLVHRSLAYHDPFTQNVGDYSLAAAPVADVGMRVYPGAFLSKKKWAALIGLDLHGAFAFGLSSQTSDGTKYNTSYHAYDASLFGRYPIGRHEIHAAVGYGAQAFTMKDNGTQQAPVPDVDYRSVRMGGGARFQVSDRIGVGLDGAFLVLTSLGELSSSAWFPRASGNGIQGQLYADASVYKGLKARLFMDYQRQFFNFNSKTGDSHIAGGAVDQYLTAGLGLGYVY